MVPIHRRKLVVQKAQEGKLFELPKPFIERKLPSSATIPQSPRTLEGFTEGFSKIPQAAKTIPKNLLKATGLRSPLGIASLVIAGLSGTEDLVEDEKKKLLDLYDTRMFKGELDDLRRRRADEELNREAFDPNIPKVPGGAADTRRKQFEERDAMSAGDFMQLGQDTINPPPIGNNPAAQGIDNQRKAIDDANKLILQEELKLAKQGRLAQIQGVKDLVKDIMGEEGYDKAGNLMLLQLAANLLSGKTDQRGFTGFLDVLGQAGQKVIPLAIALERERQKDELDLTKSLITQLGKDRKTDKIDAPKQRVLLTDRATGQDKIRYATPTDDGKFRVFETINGVPKPYTVDPSEIKNFFKLEENPIERRKFVADYRAKAAGNAVVGSVLEIVKRNPDAAGAFGGINLIYGRSLAQVNQLMGGKDYADSISKLVDELSADLPDAIDLNKPKANAEETSSGIKASNEIFTELKKIAPLLNSTDETLRDQAQLRTFELIAVYSLAQINKRQDRIAVSDVNNARDIAGGLITYVPFINASVPEIVARYSVLGNQFKTGMQSTVKDAFVAGIDLSDIEEKYNKAFNIESPTKKIIDKTTRQNQDDFSKLFTKDKIGDALLK